jgi:cytochrome c oxidase assembly protein subunit 15
MAAIDTSISAAARPSNRGERQVRAWLLMVIGLVFCMIVVGGATRLTGSGLSITEWQPIMGAIPPLSDDQWQAAFAKYKQIPQYQRVNKGMSPAEFKTIFYWEWGHRLLGRLIGVVFAVPLAWFWWRGHLRADARRPLLGILALGGVQGAVGWYMVASGLVDRVSVSQYRLALHLTIAFLILAALVWMWLSLGGKPAGLGRASHSSSSDARRAGGTTGSDAGRVAWLLFGLLTVQVVAGALVAGMKAGLAYNTWPLMDGAIVPAGLLVMSPWWINPFENALMVQFNHRLLAYVILALSIWQAVRLVDAGGGAANSALALAFAITIQAVLGIWTLLAHVPLSLGLVHQGGAAVVYAVAIWHVHAVTRPAGDPRS